MMAVDPRVEWSGRFAQASQARKAFERETPCPSDTGSQDYIDWVLEYAALHDAEGQALGRLREILNQSRR